MSSPGKTRSSIEFQIDENLVIENINLTRARLSQKRHDRPSTGAQPTLFIALLQNSSLNADLGG